MLLLNPSTSITSYWTKGTASTVPNDSRPQLAGTSAFPQRAETLCGELLGRRRRNTGGQSGEGLRIYYIIRTLGG